MDFSKKTFIEIAQTAEQFNVAGVKLIKFDDMIKILQLVEGNQILMQSNINVLTQRFKALENTAAQAVLTDTHPAKQFQELINAADIDKDKLASLFNKIYFALVSQVQLNQQLRNSMSAMTANLEQINHQTSLIQQAIDQTANHCPQQITLDMGQ